MQGSEHLRSHASFTSQEFFYATMPATRTRHTPKEPDPPKLHPQPRFRLIAWLCRIT